MAAARSGTVPRKRPLANLVSIYPGARLGRNKYTTGTELSDDGGSAYGASPDRVSKADMQSRDELKLPETRSLNKGGLNSSGVWTRSQRGSTRSLHGFSKQKETSRIEQENLKLAKKIFEIRPSIVAADQVREWKYSKAIEKNLR